MRLSKHIFDEIVGHARGELPDESCGLLLGSGDKVEKLYPMTNIDHSPEHFSFDPAEQFQALRFARTNGWDVIANYHSHPSSPSRPSLEDIKLAYDSNIRYLILSLASQQVVLKAFRIKDGTVTEEELVIEY